MTKRRKKRIREFDVILNSAVDSGIFTVKELHGWGFIKREEEEEWDVKEKAENLSDLFCSLGSDWGYENVLIEYMEAEAIDEEDCLLLKDTMFAYNLKMELRKKRIIRDEEREFEQDEELF